MAEDNKKNEKKPLGLRADEELAAAFRQFVAELGQKQGVKNLSQDAALRELLKLADVDKIKERVPGRADEIEDVRTLLDQFLTKYLASVDAAALSKEKAEADVKMDLDNKSRYISDLLKKQDELKERVAKLEESLDKATSENDLLQVEINKLNKAVEDKDALILSLKNNAAAVDAVVAIAELKELVANMKKESEPEPAGHLADKDEN